MADLALPEVKKTRRTSVSTQNLKHGDLVVGCEKWEIMLPATGLYIGRVEYDADKYSPTAGCSLVYWGDKQTFEAFNPYWTWYVENRCILCNEPDPHDCTKLKEIQHGEGEGSKEGQV
jgi:hypothetical protein